MFADAMTFIETATRRPPRNLAPETPVPFEVLAEAAPARIRGSALAVRGLVKTFDKGPVIKGLDLEIPAGQFVAVVGKSGCGKSTLLRLILGLETPTAGTIEGVGATGGTARFIFQEPRLLPWATVVDNVTPAMRLYTAQVTLV